MKKSFFIENNSGQISMEFIITIIMVLIVFLFGLMLFQDRVEFNNNKSLNWQSEVVANQLSRNINNVYLSDQNVVLLDYIYWRGLNRKVVLFEKTISVFHEFGFIDVPILADVELRVVDFNGPIIFEKSSSKIIVRNQ